MSDKPRSASNPDQPRQPGHTATRDRMSSNGDDYAHDNNRSGEGNDASHTAGPSFVREVGGDGSVAGASRRGERAQASDNDTNAADESNDREQADADRRH